MRYWATLMVLVALPLTGCTDEEAAQRRQARQDFEEALQLFQRASAGFVPGDAGRQADLAAYRQATLQEAAQRIERTINQANPGQQAAARRLMAAAYASSARHQGSEAIAAWASLSADSANVLARLSHVASIAARAAVLGVDQTPVLQQLRNNRREWEQQAATLQSRAQELTRQIEELESQIAQHESESTESLTQGRQVRERAFVAEGQERLDLYNEATELERAGDRAAAAAQTAIVKRDVLAAELGIINERLRLSQQAIASLDREIEAVTKRQNELSAQHRQAAEQRDAAADEVLAQVQQLKTRFDTEVDAPLQQAADQMRRAQEALAQAAGGDRGLEQELLATQVARAQLLAHHALATSGFATTLEAVGEQAQLLWPNRRDFEATASELRASVEPLAEQAQAVIDDASALYSRLVQGASEGAAVYLERLRDQMLDAHARVQAAATNQPLPVRERPAPTTRPQPAMAEGQPDEARDADELEDADLEDAEAQDAEAVFDEPEPLEQDAEPVEAEGDAGS